MKLTYTVSGENYGEIATQANAVLAKFMGNEGHYTYGIEISVVPQVELVSQAEPILWEAEVTVSDLKAES